MYIQEVSMVTKIQRWGNSLGVRIPKAFAEQAGVGAGSAVEIDVEGNALIIRAKRGYDLTSLLAGVTADNLHEAIETGPPVGREVW
jgi:antitoxin MazE